MLFYKALKRIFVIIKKGRECEDKKFSTCFDEDIFNSTLSKEEKIYEDLTSFTRFFSIILGI